MRKLPHAIGAMLPAFVDDVRATLGDRLVGAYLYGSAVAGGFDADRSDLDLAVVLDRSTDEVPFDELGGIIQRLAIREPDWADRLDVVFVGRPILATFREGGPLVSISHYEPLQRYDEADDWLQTWFLVRMADTAIAGPPIDELIPPIGLDEFVAAVSKDADRIVRRALEQEVSDELLAYTVLTVARVACVRETGEIVPKDDAGRWVAGRMPDEGEVLETAISVRHGGRAGSDWRAAVRRLLAELVPFER